jgi:hypothetical protein
VAERGPNERAKGIRSQCRRSVTIVENAPAVLDSAVGARIIGGNTLTGAVATDLRSVLRGVTVKPRRAGHGG